MSSNISYSLASISVECFRNFFIQQMFHAGRKISRVLQFFHQPPGARIRVAKFFGRNNL